MLNLHSDYDWLGRKLLFVTFSRFAMKAVLKFPHSLCADISDQLQYVYMCTYKGTLSVGLRKTVGIARKSH